MNGHVPVLSKEVIELLSPRPGAVFVDCTLGGAGHAALILARIQPLGRLLGLDRDPAALGRAAAALAGIGNPEPVLLQGDFADLERIAAGAGFQEADGILFDLGVSSFQLDDPGRGFSFRADGPLDMRMDPGDAFSAERLVNTASEQDLARIIRTLGEERWSARIAQFIVRRRPLHTTRELAAAVEAAIPRAAWPQQIHPATRTFQALRMEVNDELGSLERGLQSAIRLLRPGGRVAVISFHSLEDHAVKTIFKTESKDCICPPRQPVCTCGHRASVRVITRRPLSPGPEELEANPRSRSARMRVAERL